MLIIREMLLGDIMHLEGKPFWNEWGLSMRDAWQVVHETGSWHHYFKLLAEEFGLAP